MEIRSYVSFVSMDFEPFKQVNHLALFLKKSYFYLNENTAETLSGCFRGIMKTFQKQSLGEHFKPFLKNNSTAITLGIQ